jgi:hypothetical protein
MKITVHTLATDDDNGTSSGAFATEDEMWDSLIEGTGKYGGHSREDADEWLKVKNDPDLTYHDWWEAHRGDLDSYTCDEVQLDIDLCAVPIPESVDDRLAQVAELQLRITQLNRAEVVQKLFVVEGEHPFDPYYPTELFRTRAVAERRAAELTHMFLTAYWSIKFGDEVHLDEPMPEATAVNWLQIVEKYGADQDFMQQDQWGRWWVEIVEKEVQ